VSEVTVTYYPNSHNTIAVMDGETLQGTVNLEAETQEIEIPWSVEDTEPGAGVWKRYAPGLTTWTLTVDGKPVFSTTDTPVKTQSFEYVRFSWGVS
jgi:hypothetical protein